MSTDVVTPAPVVTDGLLPEEGSAAVRVDGLADLRAVARELGAVAALTALGGLLPVAALPGECVLLPDDVPPPAGWARVGEVVSDAGTLLVWRAPRAAVVRGSAARAAEASGPAAPDEGVATSAADAAWRVGVAWVRTGLCERLTDRAVERLRGRTVGGTATVNLPPVRLVLADAALAHLEAQSLLGGVASRDESPAAGSPGRRPVVSGSSLARVTAVLDRSSRAVHNLFGASGYVDGDAARLARTIDLLGHASGTLPGRVSETHHGREGQDA